MVSPVDVSTDDDSIDGVLAWLLERSRELAPAAIGTLVDQALGRVGARASCVFLVDHDQVHLQPFGPGAAAHGSQLIRGTIAGRCFALEAVVAVPVGGLTRLWVPLIDGTARLGVLLVDLDDGAPPAARAGAERVAALTAELVVSKSQYTDVVELTRRRRPMSLQAEMQRTALPPVALVTSEVAVAGILLPAYEVAGDSFDYALNNDRLDLAVIDSVGHDLESSTVSHVVSSALRNARRNGLDLPETYRTADAALRRLFPNLQFATAAFGYLDLHSGLFRWVSAGHPPPLLIRGGRVVGEATTTPVVPIGLGADEVAVNEVALEAGDALLIYTDGVTEGGVRGTERFGIERLIDLLDRGLLAGLTLAEVVRRLAIGVLDHTAHELHDDLTLLLFKYRQSPAT